MVVLSLGGGFLPDSLLKVCGGGAEPPLFGSANGFLDPVTIWEFWELGDKTSHFLDVLKLADNEKVMDSCSPVIHPGGGVFFFIGSTKKSCTNFKTKLGHVTRRIEYSFKGSRKPKSEKEAVVVLILF